MTAAPAANAAVFLDRDGVLNDLVSRDGGEYSPRTLADFRIRPDAADAVRRLHDAGYLVFVVTNQPDIARGRMAPEEHDRMMAALRSEIRPDDIAECPHDDADACHCRKPLPGMLHALASKWNVDLSRSVMIGDTARDVHAGRAAGCYTILVGDKDIEGADARTNSLTDAVNLVTGQHAQAITVVG